jgi:hypothetical protein
VHPLLADPWIAAQVDAAVAPYVGRLPAAEVAWMRDQLAETLGSDPRAQKLLRRARPPTVDRSGEVRREPAVVRDEGAPQTSAAGVIDLAEKRSKAAG